MCQYTRTNTVFYCVQTILIEIFSEWIGSAFSFILPKLRIHAEFQTKSPLWAAEVYYLTYISTAFVFVKLCEKQGPMKLMVFALPLLCVSCVVGGFANSSVFLAVVRAFQGLGVAALQPARYQLLGSKYGNPAQKTIMCTLVAASAPLGYFIGLTCAAYLPWRWYFWLAGITCALGSICLWISRSESDPPHVRCDKPQSWITLMMIPCIFLPAYALSAVTYEGWSSQVIACLVSGTLCIIITAICARSCPATSPLIPAEFFQPRGVKPILFICIMFYSTYGIFNYFVPLQAQTVGISPRTIVLWYIPMTFTGCLLAIACAFASHCIPLIPLLLFAGLGWIGAPLLLALAPLSNLQHYRAYTIGASMFCTMGLDPTFTVTSIFLAIVQKEQYQGLAGTMNSFCMQLSATLSLALANVVIRTGVSDSSALRYDNAFWLGVGFSGTGVLVCLGFMHHFRNLMPLEAKDLTSASDVESISSKR